MLAIPSGWLRPRSEDEDTGLCRHCRGFGYIAGRDYSEPCGWCCDEPTEDETDEEDDQ